MPAGKLKVPIPVYGDTPPVAVILTTDVPPYVEIGEVV